MVVCLTGARFNMKADILRQGYDVDGDFDTTDTDGEWAMQQDPDTGEFIRKWQPNPSSPNAPVDTPSLETFSCIARGITNGGLRTQGASEYFGKLYEDTDYVQMTFGANVKVGRRDRITNIRDASGNIVWVEEEADGRPPTVFNVNGVIPVLDPFGKHIESFALLERAESQ